MEQDQPLSTTRMLFWSTLAVIGVLCLAAFTQPAPEKTVQMQQRPGHWMGLLYSTVDIAAVEHGSQVNLEINFSSSAQKQHPGFACPHACPKSPLLGQLTSRYRPLVITFGQ